MQSNGEGVAVIMDNMSLILFVQIMCFKQKNGRMRNLHFMHIFIYAYNHAYTKLSMFTEKKIHPNF